MENHHIMIRKGAGGKAFCAGGDVKTVCDELKSLPSNVVGTGHRGHVHADFFRTEYEMNYLLGTSKIPQISFWDGIVMGGGVGVSVLGKFRVATEKTMFAMPETMIGLFPDVGSSSWLPKIRPAGLGLFIGLTGVRLFASDLLYAGIATHYVPSARLPALEEALAALRPSDTTHAHELIDELLREFGRGEVPDQNKAVLQTRAEIISRIFGKEAAPESDSVSTAAIARICSSLQQEADGGCAWSTSTLATLKKMSPTSLCLTHMQLQRGNALDLKACLEMEFRLVLRCMSAPDFREGIRALLVDKDNSPRWQPSDLAAVSERTILGFFAPLAASGNELLLDRLK